MTKPTVTVEKMRKLIGKLGLNEESVFGKKIWPWIKPGNPYQGQRRTHFEKVKGEISLVERGLALAISGDYIELPYQSKKSIRTHFDYRTTIKAED